MINYSVIKIGTVRLKNNKKISKVLIFSGLVLEKNYVLHDFSMVHMTHIERGFLNCDIFT